MVKPCVYSFFFDVLFVSDAHPHLEWPTLVFTCFVSFKYAWSKTYLDVLTCFVDLISGTHGTRRTLRWAGSRWSSSPGTSRSAARARTSRSASLSPSASWYVCCLVFGLRHWSCWSERSDLCESHCRVLFWNPRTVPTKFQAEFLHPQYSWVLVYPNKQYQVKILQVNFNLSICKITCEWSACNFPQDFHLSMILDYPQKIQIYQYLPVQNRPAQQKMHIF